MNLPAMIQAFSAGADDPSSIVAYFVSTTWDANHVSTNHVTFLDVRQLQAFILSENPMREGFLQKWVRAKEGKSDMGSATSEATLHCSWYWAALCPHALSGTGVASCGTDAASCGTDDARSGTGATSCDTDVASCGTDAASCATRTPHRCQVEQRRSFKQAGELSAYASDRQALCYPPTRPPMIGELLCAIRLRAR
eukprot:3103105-Rhodomonas_salina.1